MSQAAYHLDVLRQLVVALAAVRVQPAGEILEGSLSVLLPAPSAPAAWSIPVQHGFLAQPPVQFVIYRPQPGVRGLQDPVGHSLLG